jgi:hypothetical protein
MPEDVNHTERLLRVLRANGVSRFRLTEGGGVEVEFFQDLSLFPEGMPPDPLPQVEPEPTAAVPGAHGDAASPPRPQRPLLGGVRRGDPLLDGLAGGGGT